MEKKNQNPIKAIAILDSGKVKGIVRFTRESSNNSSSIILIEKKCTSWISCT